MQALRLVMLLVSVVIVYLLFVKSSAPMESTTGTTPTEMAELTKPLVSPSALPPGMRPLATPVSHDRYKQAIDRAREVGRQVQEQHAEADGM